MWHWFYIKLVTHWKMFKIHHWSKGFQKAALVACICILRSIQPRKQQGPNFLCKPINGHEKTDILEKNIALPPPIRESKWHISSQSNQKGSDGKKLYAWKQRHTWHWLDNVGIFLNFHLMTTRVFLFTQPFLPTLN